MMNVVVFIRCFAVAVAALVVAFAAPDTCCAQSVQHKHALLVAIEKYNHGRSYFNGRQHDPIDLHTMADVAALKAVLINKFQFKPEEITVLDKPDQTTHASIVKAFQKLTDETNAGDVVYFHYSGHGSRVPEHGDPSTWNEVDGWNEAIVPSDYKIEDKDHDLNYIIDDDIGSLTDKLIAKKPAICMMTFDCCHSGSISRSVELPTRNFNYPYPDPHPGVMKSTTRGTDMSAVKSFFDAKDNHLLVISAAQSNEEAHETRDGDAPMGLFTYALTRALQDSSSKTSYKDLLSSINQIMSRKTNGDVQNPQMEGQIDNLVLSGEAAASQPMVKVTQKDGSFQLDAGTLQQITVGSKYAIYPCDAAVFNDKTKVADAEVTESRFTTSDLEVAAQGAKVDLSTLKLAKAKETFHAAGDDKLKVFLGDALTPSQRAQLKKQFGGDKTIVIEDTSDLGTKLFIWDVKIDPSPGQPDALQLESPEGRMLATVLSAQAVRQGRLLKGEDRATDAASYSYDSYGLAKRLKSVLISHFVAGLDKPGDDTSMAVQLRLIPVDTELESAGPGKRPRRKYIKDKMVPADDQKKLALKDGDAYMIELKNTGTVEAYVNIIDLMPDGSVQELFPPERMSSVNENRIPSDGEWHRVPQPYLFVVTPPFGAERIKLIAISSPANLAPLLDPVATRDVSVASANPVSKMLFLATEPTRSDQAGIPSDVAWSTDLFEIDSSPANKTDANNRVSPTEHRP